MTNSAIKRERPPMPPLAVRVRVAERQLHEADPKFATSVIYGSEGLSIGMKLIKLLQALRRALGLEQTAALALDHDPALILRPYNPRIKDVARRYTPHAHDPEALIYREKANHQQKTTGRRPGAAQTITTRGSDIGLKAKFDRLEGRTKTRPKQRIPSRPFPKGRKFDARR